MKDKAHYLHLERGEQIIERRRSSRNLCAGDVFLFLFSDDNPDVPIRGALCDISEEGFRARHDGLRLSAGQLVRFQHPLGEGTATLIWTRVVGKEAESGFFVVELHSCTSKVNSTE